MKFIKTSLIFFGLENELSDMSVVCGYKKRYYMKWME